MFHTNRYAIRAVWFHPRPILLRFRDLTLSRHHMDFGKNIPTSPKIGEKWGTHFLLAPEVRGLKSDACFAVPLYRPPQPFFEIYFGFVAEARFRF